MQDASLRVHRRAKAAIAGAYFSGSNTRRARRPLNAAFAGERAAKSNHLPMFDFGTASFSIPAEGGCSAGDFALDGFDMLARAAPRAEEGGALVVWIGAGDVDVLGGGAA